MEGLQEAPSRAGTAPKGGTAIEKPYPDVVDDENERDDRRVRRWSAVAAGLLLAFTAVAFGAWAAAMCIVAVSLCLAAWALGQG
jgi:hypothetical protein